MYSQVKKTIIEKMKRKIDKNFIDYELFEEEIDEELRYELGSLTADEIKSILDDNELISYSELFSLLHNDIFIDLEDYHLGIKENIDISDSDSDSDFDDES